RLVGRPVPAGNKAADTDAHRRDGVGLRSLLLSLRSLSGCDAWEIVAVELGRPRGSHSHNGGSSGLSPSDPSRLFAEGQGVTSAADSSPAFGRAARRMGA